MTAAHIKIVQHPNPQCRSFHVNRHVSDIHMFGFGAKCHYVSDEKRPGELAEKLATALGYIPGVTDGHLDQYQISISKGEAFTWDEITPFVVGQIVANVFPDSIGEIVEISTTYNYTVDGFGRQQGIASRFGVLVDFDPTDPNPILDVEKLFDPQTLRVVVDNGEKQASADATQENVRKPRRPRRSSKAES